MLGDVHWVLDRKRLAVRAFRSATRLDSRDAYSFMRLGDILSELDGAAPRAIEALQRATRLDPRMSGVWRLLAEAYEADGRTVPAVAAYRRHLLRERGDNIACVQLGNALARLGRLAPFSAVREGKLRACLPGDGGVEEIQDPSLSAGDWIKLGPALCIGHAEALESGEYGPAGRYGIALFGQQALESLARAERPAHAGLDQSEDGQGEADDTDEGGDAVVVMEKERANAQCLLGVPMSLLDHRLGFVDVEDPPGAETTG